MIRQLPADVRSYLRSGVAITSVTQCVEEMLLNSLDAGATCVAVRVDLDCFKVQVVDNGSGIAVDQLQLLGNRYATSKCHTVSDLDNLRYFGYRGEALASIRDSCGILEVNTRTKQSNTSHCKVFQNGKPLKVTESSVPRPSKGTTVTVHDLFQKFPVRRKSTNESIELERIRQRMEGLALIRPGVSVSLRNDATGCIVLQTHKCTSSLMTFTHLFGSTKARSLSEVKGSKGHFLVDGYIGKEGHSKKDMQFVYINGRLVLKTRIHKLVNQCLLKSSIFKRKYGQSGNTPEMISKPSVTTSPTKSSDRYPVYVLDVKCPLTEYDITFDPAKTLVEFKDWDTLLQCTSELIGSFLKKENLISSPEIDLNDKVTVEVTKTGSSSNETVQEIYAISPSDLRDTLFSKRARRQVKDSKPSSNAYETPETMSVETWKAANETKCINTEPGADYDSTIHDRSETDTTESDLIGKTTPTGTTITTDEEGATVDSVEHVPSVISKEIRITERKNSNRNSSELSIDALKEKEINEKGDNQSARQMENVHLSSPKIKSACETRTKILGECQPRPFTNVSVEASDRPKSSLSEYRRSIGKLHTAKTNSVNVDASLKKMSQILPGCMLKSEKNNYSSLQRFRKQLGIGTNTDSSEVLQNPNEKNQQQYRRRIEIVDEIQSNPEKESYSSGVYSNENQNFKEPKQLLRSSMGQPIDALERHESGDVSATSFRLARKRPSEVLDLCRTTTASKLSKLVKQRAATVTVDPEEAQTEKKRETESVHQVGCNCGHSTGYKSVHACMNTLEIMPTNFEEQIEMIDKDIEALSKDILGNEQDVIMEVGESTENTIQTIADVHNYLGLLVEPCSACSSGKYFENCHPRTKVMSSAEGIESEKSCKEKRVRNNSGMAREHLNDQGLFDHLKEEDNSFVRMVSEANIRGSQLFKNLPDVYETTEFTAVPLNMTVLSSEASKENAENNVAMDMEYSTQGFSPHVQSQSGLSDRITEITLSQELNLEINKSNKTPKSEGFSPKLYNFCEEETLSSVSVNGSINFSPGTFENNDDRLIATYDVVQNIDELGDSAVNKKAIQNIQFESNDISIETLDNTQMSTDTLESSLACMSSSEKNAKECNQEIEYNQAEQFLGIAPSRLPCEDNVSDVVDINSFPSITQLLNPETQNSTSIPASNYKTRSTVNRVTFSDIFTPTQSGKEKYELDENCSLHDESLGENSPNKNSENGNCYSFSGCSSWSSCYESETVVGEKQTIVDENEKETCEDKHEDIQRDLADSADNDDTLWDTGTTFETEETHFFNIQKSTTVGVQLKRVSKDDPNIDQCGERLVGEVSEEIGTLKHVGQKEAFGMVDLSAKEKQSPCSKVEAEVAADTEANVNIKDDSPWIQMTDPATGEKLIVHSYLGTTVPFTEWKGGTKGHLNQGASLLNACDATPASVPTSISSYQGLPERYMHEFKTVPGSSRLRSQCSRTGVPITGSWTGVPIPGTSTGASTTVSSTGAPSVGSSGLHGLIVDHFDNEDDTEVQVKWRDKHAIERVPTTEETQSVEEMFSAWDNPVFENINNDVVSAEASGMPSRGTIKAFKTVHTCTFTKDMLSTVKVVGQLDNKFIACLINTDKHSSNGDADMLAVIDQHAAHERIRLEMLTEEAYVNNDIDDGRLSQFEVDPPRQLTLTEDEVRVMVAYSPEFSRIGLRFLKDNQSRATVLIQSVPECLVDKDLTDARKKREAIYWNTIEKLIKDHVELLVTTHGARGRFPQVIHKILCSQACHGAIKFGDPLTLCECEALIRDLSRCDLPFQCAHGRPSVMPVLQLKQLKTKLPQQKQRKPQLYKLTRATPL